jgi:type I restriction enzyme S subunit
VRLLDEAFEGIAIAKANAEKNLQNARALFESHLQSIFTKGGTGWAERPLIDLCSVFEDGDWIESKDQSSGGIRLIQTGNVGKGVFKDRAGKARFISESTFETLRCTEIFAGDCLVSRLPDPVGRSCIIPSTTEKMITAVDCTIMRFKKDVLIPAYFVYYSQSAHYLSSIAKLCTGTTRNRISRSNLGSTSVPVPPLSEQREIIEALMQIERQTQALEASYSKKLTVLEEFAKSLLREAFSGALEAA